MTFRRIMCPIDFSAGSTEALRTASELASAPGCSLLLVHVWEPARFVMGDGYMAPEIVQDVIRAEEAELAKNEQMAKKLGAREVMTKFASGAPWNEIVNAARNDPAIDLIVIGTHGRTGLSHVLLGSVAERVVRHAPCPVLVVRAREVN